MSDTTGNDAPRAERAPYPHPRLYTVEHLADGRFAVQCSREGVTHPVEYFAEADAAVARVSGWVRGEPVGG